MIYSTPEKINMKNLNMFPWQRKLVGCKSSIRNDDVHSLWWFADLQNSLIICPVHSTGALHEDTPFAQQQPFPRMEQWGQ